MDRRHDQWSQRGLDELASLLRDLERLSEQRLSRRRSEAHNHMRPHECNLGLQPRTTRADLCRVGLRVYATLPPRLPLEVFDDVGDVDGLSIDACLFQSAV